MAKAKREKRRVSRRDRIIILRTLPNPTFFERNIQSVKGARP